MEIIGEERLHPEPRIGKSRLPQDACNTTNSAMLLHSAAGVMKTSKKIAPDVRRSW